MEWLVRRAAEIAEHEVMSDPVLVSLTATKDVSSIRNVSGGGQARVRTSTIHCS